MRFRRRGRAGRRRFGGRRRMGGFRRRRGGGYGRKRRPYKVIGSRM